MAFSSFVGHEDAKLALILNAVDPHCGGVLFLGEKGSGKSTLARCFRHLLPGDIPLAELPLNVTEEAVLGGIDIEEAIKTGVRRYQAGILDRARGGFVYIDDVNLLSSEILALLLRAQGGGKTCSRPENGDATTDAAFQLVASMNLAETPLSPHLLDRFGMAVVWERITEAPLRKAIVRLAMNGAPAIAETEDDRWRTAIQAARQRLSKIKVASSIRESIARRCLEGLIAGHRGDMFLYYAARAHAAYVGGAEVMESDLDAVMPLVLNHRRRVPPPESEQQTPKEQPRQQQNPPPDKEDKENPSDTPAPQCCGSPSQGEQDSDTSQRQKESSPREEVFAVGESFAVRRFQFRRDRMKRGASGRKIKTLSRDKRGRYVKSLERGCLRDIAIDATIRAAAPWQRVRQAGQSLILRPEDIRYKQREKKIGHLAVFVVDGSGSMGAQRRMIAAKGAIQSLLFDSYRKRDKVAMIVFRKDHAELVLPPTASVQLASRMLRQIPTGGKTPLSAGLWLAHELLRRMFLREPEMRFLVTLITDGRANHSMTEAPPAEEIQRITALLRELPSTEFLVIDTESQSGLVRTGNARKIAANLGADYSSIEELKSESLASLVQAKRPD